MKIARFPVTLPYVAELLHLPVGTEVKAVYMSRSQYGCVEVVVTHESLKDVQLVEGEDPPEVSPMFQRDEHGDITFQEWRQR